MHSPAAELAHTNQTIIQRFLADEAENVLFQNAMSLDHYFREAYAHSLVGPAFDLSRHPYAIIALGGYGRAEQCFHSDVDLLFLFEGRVPDFAEKLVSEMLFPLWDAGLVVGHATRSIKECVKLAKTDLETLTAELDARFICGISRLYSELMQRMRRDLTDRRSEKIISDLITSNNRRHERFGDSAYLLEPNLKEGQGGLRDYHTMLWIARIRYKLQNPRDLEYLGLLSHPEYSEFREALAFIWQARNRLHLLTGRKNDQLHFEYQVKLADQMQYTEQAGQLPVERFLGRLHSCMEVVKQRHLQFLYDQGYEKNRRRRKRRRPPDLPAGLALDTSDRLGFETAANVAKQPGLMMRIFSLSVRLKIPIGSDAARLIAEFVERIDDTVRADAAVKTDFEFILATPSPTFHVLNQMLHIGLLGAFIPALKPVINRIQFDQYHLYPVARHLLLTVRTIKSMGDAQSDFHPLDKRIYKDLRHKKALLWAALLHDIGKHDARQDHCVSGARMAQQMLSAMGYGPELIEVVTFLIREHLLLIQTATRRDINDEETAIFLARRIGRVDWLKMLFLLTVADSMATGPKAWNDWTSTLLRDLFLKVLNILETGELASARAVKRMDDKRRRLQAMAVDADQRRRIDALLPVMSPRYLLYAPTDQIAGHIDLYHKLGADSFVWQVEKGPQHSLRTLTLCAQDRPGLISKVAGVLTLNHIDILDVQVFTWRNNIALDIFKVTPPPDPIFETERWQRTARHLHQALGGQLDIAAALAAQNRQPTRWPYISRQPCSVVIDNDSSSFFTLIEVTAYNCPGLLFRITDTLFRHHLDIWIAKIATKVDQVIDVFYVRDFDGQKMDMPEVVAQVKQALEAVIAGMATDSCK